MSTGTERVQSSLEAALAMILHQDWKQVVGVTMPVIILRVKFIHRAACRPLSAKTSTLASLLHKYINSPF